MEHKLDMNKGTFRTAVVEKMRSEVFPSSIPGNRRTRRDSWLAKTCKVLHPQIEKHTHTRVNTAEQGLSAFHSIDFGGL